ncbi:putative hydrolase or acyltransferase of alpha/beta superfamily [Burkholderiales bacterium JOSHI_001]|nr:putative hydrolase or acyltransferase of alpha/beta superfamily [Burkholderiales bacterium JOSHI_001]
MPRQAPAAGQRGTIVFSHGNSFPGGTYAALFPAWEAAGYTVKAVDRFGHDPAHPVTSNWPQLREQLAEFIRREAGGSPVWLVGHSLGGVLSLMVASRHPELVRGLVMLDSPVVTGWRAHSLQVAKATGLVKRVSPGRVSQKRRHHWPSAQAAHDHFAGKSAFARWAPGVLADYIRSGMVPAGDGGVALAFDRDIETRIYNTLPHHLGSLLKKHPPRCAVGFVAGTQSVEIRQVGLATTKALVRERLRWLEGTHLFPMEKPAQTAAMVLELLASMPG